MEAKKYQMCSRCLMDTTDPNITFDENGVCDRCREYEERIAKDWNHGHGHEAELEKLIADIKKSGEGKPYDCLIGLSGGMDSSYVLHLAVSKWHLRPYVLHIDCGWDLPVAKQNIKKLCDKLNVELHVAKVDEEDLREMQIAFFKTGHAGLDAPQDHSFIALVDDYAQSLGVKYILNGYNICTELVADPSSWGEGAGQTGDDVYIKDVLHKHGQVRTKHYKYTNGFKHKFWLPYVKGVKTVTPLNLVPFTRKEMEETLKELYGYEAYKQKHFEDSLTKFIEGYWNYERFGHDLRKVWYSSLIITGQMTREEGLSILKEDPLTKEEIAELKAEVIAKLRITEEDLETFFNLPKCTEKYKNRKWAYKLGIKLYTLLGLDKRIRK